MARNLALALSLTAKDTGSKVLRSALQAMKKQNEEFEVSTKRTSETGVRASKRLTEEYRRASSARVSLGIRSERDIQREIKLTMAAYNRLTRSGALSAREQSRAFRGMSERVRELRTELSGVSNTMTRLRSLKPIASTVGAVAGGVTAATMVMKDPVQRQMAFDNRNAEIANTAYNELSGPERIKKSQLLIMQYGMLYAMVVVHLNQRRTRSTRYLLAVLMKRRL